MTKLYGEREDDQKTLCVMKQLNGSQTPFRLIHYISSEDQHEYHLTNAIHLSAQTIEDIYKERWQIELFFKWVNQNQKIKIFLDTSANAVMT